MSSSCFEGCEYNSVGKLHQNYLGKSTIMIRTRHKILISADPSIPFLVNILCYEGNFVLLNERPEHVCIAGNTEYAVQHFDEDWREKWKSGYGAECSISWGNANCLLRYYIIPLSLSSPLSLIYSYLNVFITSPSSFAQPRLSVSSQNRTAVLKPLPLPRSLSEPKTQIHSR